MDKTILHVISLEKFGEAHDIQSNSMWESNPYENYAVIPDDMVEGITETKGFCDIEVIDENIVEIVEDVEKVIGTRKVVSKWIARDIPEVEEPEIVSEMEQLRADIDYISIMTGVEL